jgi:phosphoglycolate phosphatase-like HAD superfamily hydrolase
MHKLAIFRLWIALSAVSYTVYVYSEYTPGNTVILLDLDKVAIQGRVSILNCFRCGLSILWSAPNKYEIIKTFYQLYKDRKKIQAWSVVLDEATLMKKILSTYPSLLPHELVLQKLMATAQPIEGTIKIAERLRQQGFLILPASNMSQEYYDLLIDCKVLPTPLFSKDFAFMQTTAFNKKGTYTFDGEEQAYVRYARKPEREYYLNIVQYLAYKGYTKEQYEYMIFIDDKQENIEGACKAHRAIKGICFTSSEQLEKELAQVLLLPYSLPAIT